MKTQNSLVWVFLGLTALSCQPTRPMSGAVIWSHEENQQEKNPPEVFKSPAFSLTERSQTVLNEKVSFAKQRWGLAVVDGGSLQLVKDENGNLLYGRARFIKPPEENSKLSQRQMADLDRKRFVFLETLKDKKILPADGKILSDPQLTLLMQKKNKFVLSYAVDVLDPENESVFRFFVSPNFALLKEEVVSSQLDSEAWIYTLQNHTNLQQVLLKNLLQGPDLNSLSEEVNSESDRIATPQSGLLRFPLEDPRFDQVQAYYFIEEGIHFFAKDLDFSLPQKVHVETSEGYPKKSNAAFTYGNQIRLGAGDDITYHGIARDPSIVIHELGHVLIGAVANLPTQGEGGSLNEAFADFFAASYLDNPKMGSFSYLAGPYKRDLEEFIPYSEKNGGLYHDSQIVSGTLWLIRAHLGKNPAEKLALKCLVRLGPATELLEFPPALKAAAEDLSLSAEDMKVVTDSLVKYGWPLP